MPRMSHLLNAFNGGEVSPEFEGRVDSAKYRSGAKRIENFIVRPEGGLHRRMGSRFVAEAFDPSGSNDISRMVPFTFSKEQSYVLEFTGDVIRVFANEAIVTIPEQTFDAGDVNVTTDEINQQDHGYRHNTGPLHITLVTGTIPTPLVEDTDYWVVKPDTRGFNAVTDVVVGTDTLTISPAHNWVTEQGPFRLTTTTGFMPVGLLGFTDYYIIFVDSTHVKLATSATLAGAGTAVNITAVGAGTISITPTNDYLRDFYRLTASDGGVPIDITAANTGTNTITPQPITMPLEIDSPYTSAQVMALHFAQSADFLFITIAGERTRQLTRSSNTAWSLDEFNNVDGPYGPINTDPAKTITPSATTGHITIANAGFNWALTDIGRLVRGVNPATSSTAGNAEIYGVDTATDTAYALVLSTFGDALADSDFSLGVWNGLNSFPSSVSFFEQRLGFGGENPTPQIMHGSETSAFNDFSPTALNGTDVLATHGVNFEFATNQVNAILWMQYATRLIIGTANAVLSARGSLDGEPITPSNIQVSRITGYGSSAVAPVVVGDELVYITANSQSLRGLRITEGSEPPIPTDITLLAKHVFRDPFEFTLSRVSAVTITSMAYQQDKHQVIWCVRNDGVMVAVTYIPEQEVFAWHRHTLGGWAVARSATFASTAVNISTDAIEQTDHGFRTGEGPFRLSTTDTIPAGLSATTEYFIERVDSDNFKLRLTADGTAVDITSQGAGNHSVREMGNPKVESVAVIPAPDATHDQVWFSVERNLIDAAGTFSTFRGIEFFEDDWISGVDTDMRYVDSAPVAHTGSSVTTITGLDHLEGETVQILANGADHPDRVVASGSITLDKAYDDVLVGLGYTSEMETLRLEPADPEGASMGKVARIDHLVLRLYQTVGGKFGPNEDELDDLIFRDADDPMDESVPFFTGDVKVPFEGRYEREKRLLIRQDRPLPLNLLAMNILGNTAPR